MDPLAPVFAASLAVQQILEAIGALVEERFGGPKKKAILGAIGFVIGLILATYFELNVMKYFGVQRNGGIVDKVVTALILSAGTEGVNSIVKFLKYLKEDKKATAAETLQTLRARAGDGRPAVSTRAQATLERLRGGRAAPAEDGAVESAAFSYISRT